MTWSQPAGLYEHDAVTRLEMLPLERLSTRRRPELPQSPTSACQHRL